MERSVKDLGRAKLLRQIFINATDPGAVDRYMPWEECPPLVQDAWIQVLLTATAFALDDVSPSIIKSLDNIDKLLKED